MVVSYSDGGGSGSIINSKELGHVSNTVIHIISCRGIMKQFGNHVAQIAIVFMLFSTGMFISAAGKWIH